jgi:hypothetical protein
MLALRQKRSQPPNSRVAGSMYQYNCSKRGQLAKGIRQGQPRRGWGLTQSYLKKSSADYHGAIELWLKRHGLQTILCLVQFEGVSITEMPRMYLARPSEIAQRLRETANGRGDAILYEKHAWGTRAFAAGTTEQLPVHWAFTAIRVEHLLETS